MLCNSHSPYFVCQAKQISLEVIDMQKQDLYAGIMFSPDLIFLLESCILQPAVIMHGRWRSDDDGDIKYNSVLSLSPSACAYFSVLWKVLLSVGPRLTPTETVNYQRWQRRFHLATITHIPQPSSKDLWSPTQVQGGCSAGTSWGSGNSGCRSGLMTLSYRLLILTYHSHNTLYFSVFSQSNFIGKAYFCTGSCFRDDWQADKRKCEQKNVKTVK